MTEWEKTCLALKYHMAAMKAMATWRSLNHSMNPKAYEVVDEVEAHPDTLKMLVECCALGVPLIENPLFLRGQIAFSISGRFDK